MTWQRIDENTYIDDTLVTCAEYQLFIDEMREYRYYYQPDHWTSYQFPNGQARKPIVGVRFGDAKYFCEWLTAKDTAVWNYRLPKSSEVEKQPMAFPLGRLPLGYWISAPNNSADFIMANKAQSRVSAIDLEFDLSRTIENLHQYVKELDKRAFNRFRIPELPSRGMRFTRSDFTILRRARENARKPIRKLIAKLEFGSDLFDKAVNIDYYIKYRRDASLRKYSIEETLSNINSLIDSLGDASSIAEKVDRKLILELEQCKNNAAYIGINLNALQERIAGHSPAIEGIRLVKERIR